MWCNVTCRFNLKILLQFYNYSAPKGETSSFSVLVAAPEARDWVAGFHWLGPLRNWSAAHRWSSPAAQSWSLTWHIVILWVKLMMDCYSDWFKLIILFVSTNSTVKKNSPQLGAFTPSLISNAFFLFVTARCFRNVPRGTRCPAFESDPEMLLCYPSLNRLMPLWTVYTDEKAQNNTNEKLPDHRAG